MINQCLNCKHFQKKKSFMPVGKCDAFPDRIPKTILEGNYDHTKKHPDQKNDILFEEIKK